MRTVSDLNVAANPCPPTRACSPTRACPPPTPATPTPRRVPISVTVVRLALFATLLAGVPGAAAQERRNPFETRATPLFDGESLQGWEGNLKWFRVEQGAIVAGSLDERIPHNEFLCTRQTFRDFELRLEARLVGEGNNAGIQFRSRRVPDSSEVIGYQADMGAIGDRLIWGALYDESRRREMLAEPDQRRLRERVRVGDWNDFRIRCVGNRIQIFLNGERTVDYRETDESIAREGLIGLQIHSGAPAEASYRNIRILPL